MSASSKKMRDALPLSERAGYKLNREEAFPVLVKIPGSHKTAAMGYIDPTTHIYQGGGELHEIIYRPTATLSVPMDVWDILLAHEVRTLELIDHESNSSYRIGIDTMKKRGKKYSTRRDERWGVHLRYVEHVDAQGQVIKGMAAPVDERQGKLEF